MPRKKSKRKVIQKAARAAQPKPQRVEIIGHVGMGSQGLAMAVLASGIMRDEERRPLDGLRKALKEGR